jgi:glycosyltransferase involved in cell wall biosynthesis
MKKKRILFYSSVPSKELFERQLFYKVDITILKDLGYKVLTSNHIVDFLFFWKYDIAFIYFYRWGLFPAILSRLFFKKVYFTGGIDDLDEKYSGKRRYLLQRLFFKWCYFFSTHCIVVSSSDEKNIKSLYKTNLNKISLSYHSIDIAKYTSEPSTIKSNDFLTIAWMENKENVIRKGIDTATKVFYELSSNYETYKNSKFYIMGTLGEGSDYLKSLIQELNLTSKVIFTGPLTEDDKIDFLQKSKYYFQLSLYEGFGMAAIEALAAGDIVIHSGKGGLMDAVGSHGILFNVNENYYSQIDYCHQQIQRIDPDFINSGIQFIIDNYSYERRKQDFERIIG